MSALSMARLYFALLLFLTSCASTPADAGRIPETCGELRPVEHFVVALPPSLAEWGPALDMASRTWNEAVGREVFAVRRTISELEPSMPLVASSPRRPRGLVFVSQSAGTRTFTVLHWVDCVIEWAEMSVSDSMHPDARTRALTHELGHVLGLAHDGDWRSIMRGQGPGPDILPGDLELVRQ